MATKKWVDGPTICRVLDLADTRSVERLVSEGLIAVRRLPGVRNRYLLSDAEQLARLSVRPTPTEAASC